MFFNPIILSKSKVVFLLLVALFLGYFVYSNPWYPAAKLHVTGKVAEDTRKLIVRWNSGNDLNGYEMRRFTFTNLSGRTGDNCDVSITHLGGSDMTEKQVPTRTIVTAVTADGADIPFSTMKKSENVSTNDGLLYIHGDQQSVEFSTDATRHLRFSFLTFNYASEVEVDVCGDIKRKGLYTSNDFNRWSYENSLNVDYWYLSENGEFEIHFDMPRYWTKAFLFQAGKDLIIDFFRVVDEYGDEFVVDQGLTAPIGIVYQTRELEKERVRYFHPHRLVLQVVYSVVSALLVMLLFARLSRYKSLTDCFIHEGRVYFWLMFAAGIVVFSFWHIAFWPGIMSTDSLKIWRAAHIPGMYLGDHPTLNVLLYKYFMFFWDNPAVIPVAQNILCSLLVAGILFSCYSWGVPGWVITVFYLLTITSVPIGLYNAVLWKDVPFALLTVAICFVAADMYFRSRLRLGNTSIIRWVFLSTLLILAVGVRYNGAIYLIVIPMLFLLLGVVRPSRKLILYSVLFIAIVVTAGSFFQPVRSNMKYFSGQISHLTRQTVGDLSPEYMKVRFQKYRGIFNVNQAERQWDHLRDCFYGRYSNTFLNRVKWSDTYPYLPLPKAPLQKDAAALAKDIDRLSYTQPWVNFTWNPWFLLYGLLLVPFLIKWLPMSSIFSIILLCQIWALIMLDIINWRYYYFAFLGLHFLIPLMIADRRRPLKHG